MIPWVTVEAGIHAWVVAGSQLAPENVIWSHQNAPRPTGKWISLNVINISRIGRDWVDQQEVDDPDPGQEIEYLARGPRLATLSVQCFGGPGTVNAPPAGVGITSPRATLDRVVASAALPTILEALNVAGIGIASFDPVQYVGAMLNSSIFEPRATFVARLNLASEISEFGTYVEFVEITNLNTEETFFVPEDPSP